MNPPAQASTAALFRAVAAGEITPEQASDTVVARKAAASTRFQRPNFIPPVVWAILVIVVSTVVLPADRRD